MKLEKYIYQLLLENETVIIPGFGAFVSDYQPAVIDLENSEVKPPSKNISFTSKIRNNDGMLVNCIAESEGISHFNALKSIEKERDKLQISLDKGSKVKLENVGTLWLIDKNNIGFEPGFSDNMLLDSFGLDVVSLAKPANESNEKTISEVAEKIKAPEFQFEPDNVENSVGIDEENKDENDSFVSKSPEIKEHVFIEEPVSLNQDVIQKNVDVDFQLIENHENSESAKPIFSTNSAEEEEKNLVNYWKEQKSYNYEQEVKPNRKWWLLLLLIPIFIGGYFLFNKKQKNPESTIKSHDIEVKKQDNQLVINSDSNKIDSVVNDSVKNVFEEKKVENPVLTTEIQKGFYLVGGSFTQEENVEKYISKLKKKGIEGIRLGKKGKFYLVGVARFETEKEAYKALNAQMRADSENELWVLKK